MLPVVQCFSGRSLPSSECRILLSFGPSKGSGSTKSSNRRKRSRITIRRYQLVGFQNNKALLHSLPSYWRPDRHPGSQYVALSVDSSVINNRMSIFVHSNAALSQNAKRQPADVADSRAFASMFGSDPLRPLDWTGKRASRGHGAWRLLALLDQKGRRRKQTSAK